MVAKSIAVVTHNQAAERINTATVIEIRNHELNVIYCSKNLLSKTCTKTTYTWIYIAMPLIPLVCFYLYPPVASNNLYLLVLHLLCITIDLEMLVSRNVSCWKLTPYHINLNSVHGFSLIFIAVINYKNILATEVSRLWYMAIDKGFYCPQVGTIPCQALLSSSSVCTTVYLCAYK